MPKIHARGVCPHCRAKIVHLTALPGRTFEIILPLEGGPPLARLHDGERCRFHQFWRADPRTPRYQVWRRADLD